MMRYAQIVENQEVIPYGHWISPFGDVHDVPYEGHETAIYEIENCSYGDAIYAGWIRTSTPRMGNGYTPNKKWNVEVGKGLTSRGIGALRNMMEMFPGSGANIDIIDSDFDEDDPMKSYRVPTSDAAAALLNAYRAGTLMDNPMLQGFFVG